MVSTSEFAFQNDMLKQLVSNGWLLGKPEHYNRELALYSQDVLGFVKDTQDAQWQKFKNLYPPKHDNKAYPEQKFLERVASQLNKADSNAANKEIRTFGTLGVLRHELRDRGTRFSLCQFKPEHDLNSDTLARYKKNRFRVVPELVYSPWAVENRATDEHEAETGVRAKKWRIDLVLLMKIEGADEEVESKKARVKLNQWVRLHDYNIAQKVQVIIEHFKNNVMGLLGGQAKAMLVTSSRKEAVRFKLGFDKYIARKIDDKGYQGIHAMVAFSGEVEFNEKDPNVEGLLGEKFTETNMNPNLKGRDMRKAFDSDDYQVMIVVNKFQTGFDQPKLCAMYVDKKLGGVECVQTLSRLNRTFPGKVETGTFILDFFNEPEDILESFQPYYQTAELDDVTDPDLIFDLFDKLRAADIFRWNEVEQFCNTFFVKSKSNAAIANICKPAVERWQKRYKSAIEAYK